MDRRRQIDYLDEVVRRPELMYSMHLEPGDVQLLSNHTALHSRTSFTDHEEEGRKRTLYRLWLATPDSVPLPVGWERYFRSRSPGVVRGMTQGQHYTEECRDFDAAQALAIGMSES